MFRDFMISGMWFGWLFWLVILALIVWAIVNQLNKNKQDTQIPQQESVLYILKRRYTMKKAIYLFSIITLIFQGCMMGGMGMMGMGHQQDQGEMNSEKAISKEFIFSNYKLTAEFPIPKQHRETEYSLTITNLLTKQRVIQAEVFFEAKASEKTENINRTENAPSNNEKLVSNKIEANENGEFRSSFLFHSVSKVNLGFKVVSLENEEISFPIEIFSDQYVTEEHDNKESGSWIDPFWLIGAATMTAIMIFFHL